MRGRLVAALLVGFVACRDSNDGAERRAGALSVRTATLPSPPDSGIASALTGSAPLGAACLAGDPASGTRWTLEGLAAELPPLPVNTIEELSPRDSARLAARLTRVADAIPSDTAHGDFRGLTMVVQAAWRVILAPGETLFAARSVRRLPIESAPLEETTRFVAVPIVQPGKRDPLGLRWSSREVGPEESADPRDLVSAMRVRARPALLFARASADTVEAELLLRGDSTWSLAWRGYVPRCPPR